MHAQHKAIPSEKSHKGNLSMKFMSPEVVSENTRQTDFDELRTGDWAISASLSGATSFSGRLGCEPQSNASTFDSETWSILVTFTFTAAEPSWVRTASVSNFQSLKRLHWLSLKSDSIYSVMSAPLTGQELADIHRGIEEIRLGKAKHFNNARETIESLHRERSK